MGRKLKGGTWHYVASCEQYVLRIIGDYLRARVLICETAGVSRTYTVMSGIPLVSVLGPILWNIKFLRVNLPAGTKFDRICRPWNSGDGGTLAGEKMVASDSVIAPCDSEATENTLTDSNSTTVICFYFRLTCRCRAPWSSSQSVALDFQIFVQTHAPADCIVFALYLQISNSLWIIRSHCIIYVFDYVDCEYSALYTAHCTYDRQTVYFHVIFIQYNDERAM